MFSQNSHTPNNETIKTFQSNPRYRRKKPNKKKRKNRKSLAVIKKTPIQPQFTTMNMAAWAGNYTNAVTWQLRQQITFWKTKATTLDYENKILHEIIRKNYVSTTVSNDPNNEAFRETDVGSVDVDPEDDGSSVEFDASEELVEFLMQNQKYKDDAKRERERLRASEYNESNLIEKMEAMPTRRTEENEETLKSLYGEHWQRISAIETSILSQFIDNCDQDKPSYWPIVALNSC